MSVNYREYELKLYTQVSLFEKLFPYEGEGAEPWKNAVLELERTLETRRFRVAVVGAFNRGKTCFVNALLGKRVLPEDCVPTTATLNRITYGDVPHAFLRFHDGRNEDVAIEQLAEHVTKLTGESAQRASEIKEAVVEYPTILCNNGIDLIDTPGMNDEEAMNQLTIEKLKDIDLSIIMVDATAPFDMTECDFTLKLLESPHICQIVVVVSKLDLIREREREKLVLFIKKRVKDTVWERLVSLHGENSGLTEKYHRIFDELHLFPVSALDALDALSCNDMELYEKSGFSELNNRLPQIIMRSQNQNLFLNSANHLSELMKKNREWVQQRMRVRPELDRHFEALQKLFRKRCDQLALRADWREDIAAALPDISQELAVSQKQFSPAIQSATAGYAGLRSALSRVIPVLQERWSREFSELERHALSRNAASRRDALNRELDALLNQSHPMLKEAMRQPMEEFRKAFSFQLPPPPPFQWSVSPIPPAEGYAAGQNILQYTQRAVEISLKQYRIQRSSQLAQALRGAQARLSAAATALIAALDSNIKKTIARLSLSREGDWLIQQLQGMERSVSNLKERYLSEMNG